MNEDIGGHYLTLSTDDGWTARIEVYPYPVPDYEGALVRWLDEHGHKEVANNYRAHVNECDAAQVDPQDIACFVSEATGISVMYPDID
jgi:hypothetical protein